MEIERKWLIDAFPTDLPLIEACEVEQGYIATAPAVRIRACRGGSRSPYRLCFKGEGTLVREEIETDLDADTYHKLKAFIGKPLITKDFRVYRLPGGEALEVSLVDKGLPTQFMYAEVEFDSEQAAHAFAPPACLGAEKTEEAGFSMRSYWLQTRG